MSRFKIVTMFIYFMYFAKKFFFAIYCIPVPHMHIFKFFFIIAKHVCKFSIMHNNFAILIENDYSVLCFLKKYSP